MITWSPHASSNFSGMSHVAQWDFDLGHFRPFGRSKLFHHVSQGSSWVAFVAWPRWPAGAPVSLGWVWSVQMCGCTICVFWHPHECHRPGFPSRILRCNAMGNAHFQFSWSVGCCNVAADWCTPKREVGRVTEETLCLVCGWVITLSCYLPRGRLLVNYSSLTQCCCKRFHPRPLRRWLYGWGRAENITADQQ